MLITNKDKILHEEYPIKIGYCGYCLNIVTTENSYVIYKEEEIYHKECFDLIKPELIEGEIMDEQLKKFKQYADIVGNGYKEMEQMIDLVKDETNPRLKAIILEFLMNVGISGVVVKSKLINLCAEYMETLDKKDRPPLQTIDFDNLLKYLEDGDHEK